MMLIGILKPNTSPVYLLLHHASVYRGVRKNKCCLLVTQVTTWRHCYWTPLAYQCLCRACMCNNALCVLAVLHACVCVCVCKLYACHGFLSEHKLGPGLQLTFYGIWAKSGHTYRHTNTWMTYNLHKSLSLALSLSYTHTHSHHSSSKSSITLQQQVKFNFQVRPVGCQPSGLLQLLYTQCFFSL